MKSSLQARKLTKSFAGRPAVQDLDLSVESGEIVGLVGPNGAGKTTTLNMLVGRLLPDSGEVLLDGLPLQSERPAMRRQIGWAPQTLSLYTELSPGNNLRFFGQLYGLRETELAERVPYILKTFDLEDSADRKASTLSEGTRRRLNLALAFIHHPRFLVLDEPTVGLDVHSRVAFLEFLEERKNAGAAIVYAGHYLEEAERLCDRLLLMDRGRLIDQGPLSHLLDERKGRVELVLDCPVSRVPSPLTQLAESRLEPFEGGCLLSVPSPGRENPSRNLREVLDSLETSGITVIRLQGRPPTLEEVILETARQSRGKTSLGERD